MKKILREALGILGFCMVGYGIYEIYPPASFIISGGVLFWLSSPSKGSE